MDLGLLAKVTPVVQSYRKRMVIRNHDTKMSHTVLNQKLWALFLQFLHQLFLVANGNVVLEQPLLQMWHSIRDGYNNSLRRTQANVQHHHMEIRYGLAVSFILFDYLKHADSLNKEYRWVEPYLPRTFQYSKTHQNKIGLLLCHIHIELRLS